MSSTFLIRPDIEENLPDLYKSCQLQLATLEEIQQEFKWPADVFVDIVKAGIDARV